MAGNWAPFAWSLPLLAYLFGYSYAKRFTALAHVWLGIALAGAPVGVWIALRPPGDWFAPFLQAAAIAVLMLFAIFLTRNAMTQGNLSGKFQLPALALAVLVFVSFAYTFLMARWAPSSGEVYTSPNEVADALFGQFVFPFELASVLLLVAMIGAIVVARPAGDDEAEDA